MEEKNERENRGKERNLQEDSRDFWDGHARFFGVLLVLFPP